MDGKESAVVNGQVVPARAGGRARVAERYLSVPEVAERLGTTVRFVRRLVAERRIEFNRFGKHVRISERVLDTYIEASTVPSVRR